MIKDLEIALGYKFQNITLLQNALTHSSYANERWRDSLASNERLEFLGDSILGMITAEYLYRTFPKRPEGELTRIRADLVCETTLARIANQLQVGSYLLLGKGEEQGGGRSRPVFWPTRWNLSWLPLIWMEAFLQRDSWYIASSSRMFPPNICGMWITRRCCRSWFSSRETRFCCIR